MAKQKKAFKPKSSSFSLFQWLDEVSYKKRDWSTFTDEQKQSFLPFMIHRFISMNPDYIELVNLIQKYNLSAEKVYNFYKDMLPKRKQFFKYVKKKGKENDHELTESLCKVYEISSREAEEYASFMTREEIENLIKQVLQK